MAARSNHFQCFLGTWFLVILLSVTLCYNTVAFSISQRAPATTRRMIVAFAQPTSRRSLLLTSATAGFLLKNVESASAVVMSNDSREAQRFQAGQAMGTEEALARFKEAQTSLKYLLNNYDSIVANGGGDNVRRYLGTVGVSSGLYGIPKVLKELQESADDIVEYTEAMNEFDASLRQADTACYSANFVEFSAAKTKPEKFFQDAKIDAQRMQDAMNEMAAQLKL